VPVLHSNYFIVTYETVRHEWDIINPLNGRGVNWLHFAIQV